MYIHLYSGANMCGIVGYIGNKSARKVILEGLHRLEYRGYDSAGLTTIDAAGFTTAKCKGKVSDLEALLDWDDPRTTGIDAQPLATMAYNASGERTTKTTPSGTTRYVRSGGQVMAEYDGSGTFQNNFIYGNGRKLARKAAYYGDDRFFHHDMLGSTRLASADGGFAWSRDYMAFGLDRNATGSENNYKFTGQEDDNIGIYYYGARYYHPELGRFTQTDPLGSKFPGWSPYNYALNNPLKYVDPDGKRPLTATEAQLLAKLIMGFDQKYRHSRVANKAARGPFGGFDNYAINNYYMDGMPLKQDPSLGQWLGMMIGRDVDPNTLTGELDLDGIKADATFFSRPKDKDYINQVIETSSSKKNPEQKLYRVRYENAGRVPLVILTMDEENYDKWMDRQKEMENGGKRDEWLGWD